MKPWKITVVPILFAVGGAAFLFAALEERVIDGGPIRYAWLGFAVTFFALAVAFLSHGRKSGSRTVPPNA